MNLTDPALATLADALDDAEKVRMATANRVRILTTTEADSDGEHRGYGLTEDHPSVAALTAFLHVLEDEEKHLTKDLEKALRRHPLGPWIKAQKGVGDKQAARLLARLGDPYIDARTGTPRTVSQLWAYCGLHVRDDGAAAKRQKGVKANWSTIAKTRSWLIIQTCLKQLDPACKTETGIAEHKDGCKCSPYRIVIDERRQRTAVLHPEWTPGHSLNDAMRVASKALLRDLWREAKALHDAETAPLALAA